MASTGSPSFCNCSLRLYETAAANLHKEDEKDSELQFIHVELKFLKVNEVVEEEVKVDSWINISLADVRNEEDSMVLSLNNFLTDMGVSLPHHAGLIAELVYYIETEVIIKGRFASYPNATVVEMHIVEIVLWDDEDNDLDEAVTQSLEVDTVSTEAASEATIASLEKVQVQVQHGGGRNLFCSICYGSEDGLDFVRMPCPEAFHAFHNECIGTWLRINACCPLCRHRLPS